MFLLFTGWSCERRWQHGGLTRNKYGCGVWLICVFLHFASLFRNRALQAIRLIEEKTAASNRLAGREPINIIDAATTGNVARIADHLAVDPSRVNLRDW